MKKIEIENVLNQRKFLTHILIAVLSQIIVFINAYINNSDFTSWITYLYGFMLIFIEIEVFLFIAYFIFKNVNLGNTPGEITRIVLSRFALFLVSCFIAAFIIILIFQYAGQFFTGGSMAKVLSDFFSFGFNSWFKATLGGLTFGTGIFIVILWQDALKREQKLREENLIFQNETLKNQVNPHFLFNSLNTLSSLIHSQPDTAEWFIGRLSSIYRYILENSYKVKVPLQSELAFVKDYFDLHKIRGEEKIQLSIDVPDAGIFEILPVSLQILLENAIKHNMATREKPLLISISIENQLIIVKNNIQKMAVQFNSTKTGLKNLTERIRLVTGKALTIEESNTEYIVKVPLMS